MLGNTGAPEDLSKSSAFLCPARHRAGVGGSKQAACKEELHFCTAAYRVRGRSPRAGPAPAARPRRPKLSAKDVVAQDRCRQQGQCQWSCVIALWHRVCASAEPARALNVRTPARRALSPTAQGESR
eukprot:COSAG06_NODE_14587_length_1145_cov_1.269598_2_plen_126_part_01